MVKSLKGDNPQRSSQKGRTLTDYRKRYNKVIEKLHEASRVEKSKERTSF
jgi:hypothetical protein